jgi:selenocysteine lyase/cysteine desulfurase
MEIFLLKKSERMTQVASTMVKYNCEKASSQSFLKFIGNIILVANNRYFWRSIMEIQYFSFLKHFVRFNRRVYLDHNATTPVSNRVRKAMEQILKHQYGNPSSFYEMGRKSAGMVEQVREQVAQAIHADLSEVIFTSCASESNNAAIKSAAAHFYPLKKKIIATPIEHPSVANTLAYLQT